jgi:hypothetical protein
VDLIPNEPRFALRALGPGLVGSLTVTVVHEGLRRVLKDPPRMDVLGMRALAKGTRLLGRRPARGQRLHRQALVGDLVSNTLFYSLVSLGKPRRPYLRGLTLGLLAGASAVLLPPYLGLGKRPARAQPRTALLTVAYYTLAGLSAARSTRRMTVRTAEATY